MSEAATIPTTAPTLATKRVRLEPLASPAPVPITPSKRRTWIAPRCRPVVEIRRTRCPACNSTDLHTRHTTDNGDGTATRDTRCRACDELFDVLVK